MTELLIILIGLIVGSFLNVVISRISNPKSIFFGRSKCTSCKTQIRGYDLIPLISFVILKRKCRNCKSKISWQYPLVEFFTALLFYLLFIKFAITSIFIFSAILFCIFIVIFAIDMRTQFIPDFLSYSAIIISLVIFILTSGSYTTLFFGILFGGGFFLVQFLISKGVWIGSGDILLGIMMGVLLGWYEVVFGIFLAYIIGALVSIILLIFKKVDKKSMIAFGPFLIFSTILIYLYGDTLMNYYLQLLI